LRKDIFIYFLGKLIPAFVNLVLIILVVRFLGEDEYGRFSLISYVAILVMQLCITWIQQSMIRFLSLYKDNPGYPLSRFYFLTIISILVAALIMTLVTVLYFRLSLFDTAIVVFYTSMYILFVFRLTLYQSFMKPLKYASYEGVYNFLLLIFLLGFIYLIPFRNYIMVFVSMGAGFLLSEVIHRFFISEPLYRIDTSRVHWEKSFTKQAFNYGFPLTIWIFVSTFTLMIDRYIIKEFSGYGAAGTYSAIRDLVTKISTFALLPVSIAYYARINDAWNHNNTSKARSLIKEALLIELVIGLVVCTAYLALCNYFYSNILHLKGKGLFITSFFLVISAFLWQAAMFFQKPLELLFKQKIMLALILVTLVVNLLLNLYLIPKFGFTGAAVTALITVGIYSLLTILFSGIYMKSHLDHTEETNIEYHDL
jgi:O-antigen/teichoic acid export membrane protein